MKALVLERVRELSLREIDLPQAVGSADVKIKIDTVGVCGSDVHYSTHGRIASFVVNEPMVLRHEAAGTVVEAVSAVTGLQLGDRVWMEPGPGLTRLQAWPLQCGSQRGLLGDTAGPWRVDALCRPPACLHVQAA